MSGFWWERLFVWALAFSFIISMGICLCGFGIWCGGSPWRFGGSIFVFLVGFLRLDFGVSFESPWVGFSLGSLSCVLCCVLVGGCRWVLWAFFVCCGFFFKLLSFVVPCGRGYWCFLFF